MGTNDEKDQIYVGKCLFVEYEKSHLNLSEEEEKYFQEHDIKNDIFINNKYFWAQKRSPSKLTLTVMIDNETYEIQIDRYFRLYWGRLTQKRVNAIKATMPSTVSVRIGELFIGERRITIENECYDAWLSCAKQFAETNKK